MSNCIISSCFTTVPCPQRGLKVNVGPELIDDWASSLADCGLKGVIVYDELPEEIIDRYDHVAFARVPPPCNGYSTNDWRFFCYRHVLSRVANIEAAFFTDLFDMVVQHDPFPWLAEQGGLAVGREDRMDAGPWMTAKLTQAFGDGWRGAIPADAHRCTGCLVGGIRSSIMPFLDTMCGIMASVHSTRPKLNCNMPALQMAIHAGMQGHPVHFGHPLHHPEWRTGGRDKEAFFHHDWRGNKSPIFA